MCGDTVLCVSGRAGRALVHCIEPPCHARPGVSTLRAPIADACTLRSQVVSVSLPNSATRTQEMTRRNLNIQPTLTARPGLPMRVIVNRDLVLKPYQPLFFSRGSVQ